MKKVKGFITGLLVGASAMIYGVWNWEKKNRKRISTVMDKYYEEAKVYADNLIKEYGPDAREKIDSILQDTQKYLEETLNISKDKATKIVDELKKTVVEKLPLKKGKK